MKPPVFRYVRARSLEEATVELAKEGGEAKILAGGQSLVPMLNFRMAHPSALIDINQIPGLDEIKSEAGAVRIGALTRHYAIEMSPLMAEKLPFIAAPRPPSMLRMSPFTTAALSRAVGRMLIRTRSGRWSRACSTQRSSPRRSREGVPLSAGIFRHYTNPRHSP